MTDGTLYKWLASLLTSILLTGLAAWVTFGGGVSAAEGEELRRTDTSILQRQAVLEERLTSQQATMNEVKATIKEGNKTTQEKLDAILLSIPRGTSNDRNR